MAHKLMAFNNEGKLSDTITKAKVFVVVKEGNEVEQLSEELAPAPTGRFDDTSVGTTGNKGEEAAIQLVRPIIIEWLNNNLPSMIERFVRAEINRLAQESKRR